MTKDTDKAYNIDDLLFLKRCEERFLSVRIKSTLFNQKKVIYATIC